MSKSCYPSIFFQILFAILFVFPAFANEFKQTKTSGDGSTEYFGQLEPELIPDQKNVYGVIFSSFNNSSKYKFVRPIQTNATLTAGQFSDPRIAERKLEVLLIEPKDGTPFVCLDLNVNGIIEENDCVGLTVVSHALNDFEGTLKLPLSSGLFKNFPIFLRFRKGFNGSNLQPGDKLIQRSYLAFASGFVNIKNRRTRVAYSFDPLLPTISATDGWFGIDVNGDGKIENEPFSPESSYAQQQKELVFKLKDNYVSTSSVDLVKNQIVMRPRTAADYHRKDLKIGVVMPDFAFVDFEDKSRKLSEFRGKYLLVDFWGLWCVDCRRELPYQSAAYKRFGARGFEILALNTDEKIEPVKQFLSKNGLTWTQAKLESIKSLIEIDYQIQEYPSTILLTPDGRILILDQKKLVGAELLRTLDQILPR